MLILLSPKKDFSSLHQIMIQKISTFIYELQVFGLFISFTKNRTEAAAWAFVRIQKCLQLNFTKSILFKKAKATLFHDFFFSKGGGSIWEPPFPL